MPEICRFFGIIIVMYFKEEHRTPHFHARYGEFEASFDTKTLGLLEGKLPPRIRGLVIEWASQHQDELLEDWEIMRTGGTPKPIQPLEK
jgi:hypothetical protein